MKNKTTIFYTRGQFIDFCKSVFGSNYNLTNGGNNIEVTCPICKMFSEAKGLTETKTKLVIETEKHINHCWKCGYKSKNLAKILKKYYPNYLKDYLATYKNSILLSFDISQKDDIKEIAMLPQDFLLLAQPKYNTNITPNQIYASLNYLKARGALSDEMLWYWRFGISNNSKKFMDRIIVPSYDEQGNLNYYSARTIKDNFKPKYTNPDINRENIIFNELNINFNKELTIVEGVFDLIKCNNNATCVLGSDLTANYKLFYKIIENKTPIVLGFDPDAVKKTLMIAKRLYEFNIPVKIIDYKNYNNDIGSMSQNMFMEYLNDAIIFDMNFILKFKIKNII